MALKVYERREAELEKEKRWLSLTDEQLLDCDAIANQYKLLEETHHDQPAADYILPFGGIATMRLAICEEMLRYLKLQDARLEKEKGEKIQKKLRAIQKAMATKQVEKETADTPVPSPALTSAVTTMLGIVSQLHTHPQLFNMALRLVLESFGSLSAGSLSSTDSCTDGLEEVLRSVVESNSNGEVDRSLAASALLAICCAKGDIQALSSLVPTFESASELSLLPPPNYVRLIKEVHSGLAKSEEESHVEWSCQDVKVDLASLKLADEVNSISWLVMETCVFICSDSRGLLKVDFNGEVLKEEGKYKLDEAKNARSCIVRLSSKEIGLAPPSAQPGILMVLDVETLEEKRVLVQASVENGEDPFNSPSHSLFVTSDNLLASASLNLTTLSIRYFSLNEDDGSLVIQSRENFDHCLICDKKVFMFGKSAWSQDKGVHEIKNAQNVCSEKVYGHDGCFVGLDSKGSVYFAGEGKCFASANSATPTAVALLGDNQVKQMALEPECGSHFLMIMSDNKVYAGGISTDNGQLGVGEEDRSILPSVVRGIRGSPKSVHASFQRSAVVTDEGKLYVFGNDQNVLCKVDRKSTVEEKLGALNEEKDDKEEGLTKKQKKKREKKKKKEQERLKELRAKELQENAPIVWKPQLVSSLSEHHVTDVALGVTHTCVITAPGILWTVGNNSYGQCGDGTTKQLDALEQISVGNGELVKKVCAGKDFTVILTESGRVYTMGLNDQGQLGQGDVKQASVATLLPDLCDIIDIACGHAHTLCLSKTGLVYSFGSDEEGQCGHGTPALPKNQRKESYQKKPRLVKNINSAIAIYASASRSFCTVSTSPFSNTALIENTSVFVKGAELFVACKQTSTMSTAENGDNCFHLRSFDRDSYQSQEIIKAAGTIIPISCQALRKQSYAMTDSSIVSFEIKQKSPHAALLEAMEPIRSGALSEASVVATSIFACFEFAAAKREEEEEESKTTGDGLVHKLSRFSEPPSGDWWYGGNPDAIAFTPSCSIFLHGVSLLTGQGSYTTPVSLYSGTGKGDTIASVNFSHTNRDCHEVYFNEPVLLIGDTTYCIESSINGGSSSRGKGGLKEVDTSVGVKFTFDNATTTSSSDVTMGQFPAFFFSLPAMSTINSSSKVVEPAIALSRGFTVRSLMHLSTYCHSSWKKIEEKEGKGCEALVFGTRSSLNLIDRNFKELIDEANESISDTEKERTVEVMSSFLHEIMASPLFSLARSSPPSSEIYKLLETCRELFLHLFDRIYDTVPRKLFCVRTLLQLSATPSSLLPGADALLAVALDALSVSDDIESLVNSSDLPSASEILQAMPPSFLPFWNKVMHEMEQYHKGKESVESDTSIVQQLIQTLQQCVVALSKAKELRSVVPLSEYVAPLFDTRINKVLSCIHGKLMRDLVLCSNLQTSTSYDMEELKRFNRTFEGGSWGYGGSVDAIAFTPPAEVLLHGIGLFGGSPTCTASISLYEQDEELITVDVEYESAINDSTVHECMFDAPVLLTPDVKYHVTAKITSDSSSYGEDGVVTKDSDIGEWKFEGSSKSTNGTDTYSGQIPVLYYSLPVTISSESDQSADNIQKEKKRTLYRAFVKDVIISVKNLLSSLLSARHSLPHTKETSEAVSKYLSSLSLVSDTLPLMLMHLSALKKRELSFNEIDGYISEMYEMACALSSGEVVCKSNEYPSKTVESSHEYAEGIVLAREIEYPQDVLYLSVSFDVRCCTGQPEDRLELYVDKECSIPVIPNGLFGPAGVQEGGARSWPSCPIIVPSNRVTVVFHTATDYLKVGSENRWGFKCTVVPFARNSINLSGIRQLQSELAVYQSSQALNNFRFEPQALKEAEEEEDEKFYPPSKMEPLLRGGLVEIQEDGDISRAKKNDDNDEKPLKIEQPFFADFVGLNDNSAGARLAKYLIGTQEESAEVASDESSVQAAPEQLGEEEQETCTSAPPQQEGDKSDSSKDNEVNLITEDLCTRVLFCDLIWHNNLLCDAATAATELQQGDQSTYAEAFVPLWELAKQFVKVRDVESVLGLQDKDSMPANDESKSMDDDKSADKTEEEKPPEEEKAQVEEKSEKKPEEEKAEEEVEEEMDDGDSFGLNALFSPNSAQQRISLYRLHRYAVFALSLNPTISGSSLADEALCVSSSAVDLRASAEEAMYQQHGATLFSQQSLSMSMPDCSFGSEPRLKRTLSSENLKQKGKLRVPSFLLQAHKSIRTKNVLSFVSVIDSVKVDVLKIVLKEHKERATARLKGINQCMALLDLASNTDLMRNSLWTCASAIRSAVLNKEEAAKTAPSDFPFELGHSCDYGFEFAGVSLLQKINVLVQELYHAIIFAMEKYSSVEEVVVLALQCFFVAFPSSFHSFIHECGILNLLQSLMARDSATIASTEASVESMDEKPIVEESMDGERARKGKDLSAIEKEDENLVKAIEASLSPSEPESSVDFGDQPIAHELKEISDQAVVTVTFAEAMAASLIDASTESFWEGQEGEKIVFSFAQAAVVECVFLHIDNTRDPDNKCTSLSLATGSHIDFMVDQNVKIDIGSKHAGWVCINIPNTEPISVITVAVSGVNPRVRLVSVFGKGERVVISPDSVVADTALQTFRLLTSQVFGGLATIDQASDHNALREHMTALLFVDEKKGLSGLQTQVFELLFAEILQQSSQIKEAYEKEELVHNDSYCFEVLSILLSLSISDVGQKHIIQSEKLVKTLLWLLSHTSPRIQRQLIPILRRVLPRLTPSAIDAPPLDVHFDLPSAIPPGILQHLLFLIIKPMRFSVRDRSNKDLSEDITLDTVSKQTVEGQWVKGDISADIAHSILELLQSLRQSPNWKSPIDSAVQSAVVYLRTLQKSVDSSRITLVPELWLSIGALCLIGGDASLAETVNEATKAADGSAPHTYCDNHDDGTTEATFRCSDCSVALCTDCDRILHLPKSKREHARTPIITDDVNVYVHENTARAKMTTLMLTVDASNFKALAQFRQETGSNACRFCGNNLADNPSPMMPASPALALVCGDEFCQEKAQRSCVKTHNCGHPCSGVRDEEECLPCLYGCGESDNLNQDADTVCAVCFVETLVEGPCVQLECGHIIHLECIEALLRHRWNGPRITFGFCLCPVCHGQKIKHPALKALTDPIDELEESVRRRALLRVEFMGLKNHSKLQEGGQFYQDLEGFAMHQLCYYLCFKCKQPYYGGEHDCAAVASDDWNPEDLVCGGCCGGAAEQNCPKHGKDYLEFKCRYCCTVAIWFCFGTTHFCDICHNNYSSLQSMGSYPSCPVAPNCVKMLGEECPLGLEHPPTGEEFALGCGICRNARTF